MPTYDYKCPKCEKVAPVSLASFAHRDTAKVRCMDCDTDMERQFPFEAALGIQKEFQPYFDEALNCNVYSREQKAQILRNKGLIETGDPVRGARNYDEKAPGQVRANAPLRPGMDYEGERAAPDEDIPFVVEHANGQEEQITLGDLPTLPTANREKGAEAFNQLQKDVDAATQMGIEIQMPKG